MRLELALLTALTTMGCAAQADGGDHIATTDGVDITALTEHAEDLRELRATEAAEQANQAQHESATLGVSEVGHTAFGNDPCPPCGRG